MHSYKSSYYVHLALSLLHFCYHMGNKTTQDSSGMTLVMLAAAGGQDDLLRLLLRKGAKVNGRQKNGTTALIHAAEKVGHAACCAFLVLETESVSVEQCAGHTVI